MLLESLFAAEGSIALRAFKGRVGRGIAQVLIEGILTAEISIA